MGMRMEMEQWEVSDSWQECRKTQPLWKKVCQVLKGLNSHLFYNAESAILGTYSREIKTSPHGTRMPIAAASSGFSVWINKSWPSILG